MSAAGPAATCSTTFINRAALSGSGELSIQIGNNKDYLATRISYKLNLTGPGVGIATACSTSLVAVHFAVQSLLGFECDMALAGGASIQLPQDMGYLHQDGGILSPDGHCRAFDADAKGTVGGNGAAIVVLEALADAVADGDHLHAIIRGSAINNDGADKAGYTAPSIAGQASVIAEAQEVGEVDPASIGYIEAHGTATPLGDPIEIAALNEVFGASETKRHIGSVKTNLGHLDEAAGITGLIKTVLALQRKFRQACISKNRRSGNRSFCLRLYRERPLRPWLPLPGPALHENAPRRGRCEFLRHRRHQRPCGSRRGTGKTPHRI